MIIDCLIIIIDDSTMLDSDSVAAGCRNDRGIAPMHLLASNPACSVETLDVLFPVSNIVYDSPKFDDRPKFVKPGFKPFRDACQGYCNYACTVISHLEIIS